MNNNTPIFQQVFFTVVCFTFLSGFTSVWYSTKPQLSPQESRVFEASNTTWNLGIGAIVGLLGSKAIAPRCRQRRIDKTASDEDEAEK